MQDRGCIIQASGNRIKVQECSCRHEMLASTLTAKARKRSQVMLQILRAKKNGVRRLDRGCSGRSLALHPLPTKCSGVPSAATRGDIPGSSRQPHCRFFGGWNGAAPLLESIPVKWSSMYLVSHMCPAKVPLDNYPSTLAMYPRYGRRPRFLFLVLPQDRVQKRPGRIFGLIKRARRKERCYTDLGALPCVPIHRLASRCELSLWFHGEPQVM